MNTSSTRRLAAIMFTDIAGYTRLMQEDEARAIQLRARHRQIFEQYHAHYHGKILQYYGDGTLSIFDSSVDAVNCAIAIQQNLQAAPVVPLRIGIHLGDIIVKESEVFGDGVNVASRVESLSVPGAILLSEDIQRQLKNQPISTQSMGHFEMKNVESAMEVFAVQASSVYLPQANELRGKAKPVKTSISQPQSWIRFASIGFLAMVLGAGLFWALGMQHPDSTKPLPAKIKAERVVIIPFKNLSSNKELDIYGEFCSEIMVHGLTEAGVKTCSPRTVQQYKHLIGILPNNPEGKPSFSEVVGARYWVEGAFSQVGDSLSIQSHLTDGSNGDIVRNFPEVKGHLLHKEALIEQLTQRLMGYWVAKEVIDQGKFKVPTYEAFKTYQKIFTEVKTGTFAKEYALKAFALDSSFYLAGLYEMYWQAEFHGSLYDSLSQVLASHYSEMTPYERLRFDANQALYERDYPRYLRCNQQLFELFPQDLFAISHYCFHLLFRENQPQKAWEAYHAIDWANLSEEYHRFRGNHMMFHIIPGIAAQHYEASLALINAYLADRVDNFVLKAIIYPQTGQIDSLHALAVHLTSLPRQKASTYGLPEYTVVNFCNGVAQEFLLQEKPQLANEFLNIALTWTAESPERLSTRFDSLDLARTYRLLGEPHKALPLERSFIDYYKQLSPGVRGNFPAQSYLSGVALSYAISGQVAEAKALIKLLGANTSSSGWSYYYRARVYASLGEKETAMELLYAWKKGWGGSYWPINFFKHDYFMKNMFGYAPFEEFTQIRD